MVKKFRNFDAFIAEQKERAPVFEMFGATFTLPPSLRYDAVLELQRLAKRDKSEEMNDEETFNVFELFLGAGNVKELRKYDDFTVDVAAELVKWALEQYGLSGASDPKGKIASA